jgi:hypothetical protein
MIRRGRSWWTRPVDVHPELSWVEVAVTAA